MRKVFLALALLACTAAFAQERLIDYVNPFIGTDGFGNVYPGAQIPFGGIQISPDTDDSDYDVASGYKYNKPTIMGFSLTHLSGTGIPDLGDFLFVPGTGTLKSAAGTDTDPDSGYRSRFSHEREAASPGYYMVDLLDYGVKAEMTASARGGFLRFTYPAADSAFVMVDLNHTLLWPCEWSSVRQLDEYTIIGSKIVAGWNPDRYVYFAARFSEPIRDFVILQEGQPVIYNTKRFRSSLEAWGKGLQACVRFSTTEGQQITVRTAVSAVGTDGALLNLKEVAGKSFDEVRREAENLWEAELGKYQLDPGCDQATKETFYTSVYRTAQHPFLFQDADGRFREHDKTIGLAKGWTNYTTFSLWDTYRAFHPLLNLVNQPLQADIANSMLAHYDKSAEKMLPIWSFYGGETWCMIGYHACSVLADMIVKGVQGFDYERAYQAMKATATNPHYDCIPEYTTLGYVPFDKEKESVSKTLEYAYDDWCIAQVAKLLGHEHTWAKLLGILLTAFVLFAALVPIPYRVSAPAMLKTDHITYLSAPFDGFIQSVKVKPGDIVYKGDELLRLDQKELKLEEADLMAQEQDNRREIQKAQANRQLADLRIQQAKLSQTLAKLKTVRYKLSRSVVRCESDSAVVIEGDLQKRVGSHVNQGGELFQLASIEEIYMEADVSELEVNNVRLGGEGFMAIKSRPDYVYRFRTTLMNPTASVKDQENTFAVRGEFVRATPPWFRPGMTGIAKIFAGKRTLWWILSHQAIDYLRLKLWW